MSSTAEKHTFQAEVNEVLSLVVNSLYSHREVFLREVLERLATASSLGEKVTRAALESLVERRSAGRLVRRVSRRGVRR